MGHIRPGLLAAILLLASRPGPGDGVINVASGTDISIRDLAMAAAHATGFEGRLVFDSAKPEGAKSRSIDISRLAAMGWAPATSLADGLAAAYASYLLTLPVA